MAGIFNVEAFLDGVTGAGLFKKLNWPGAPESLYESDPEVPGTESSPGVDQGSLEWSGGRMTQSLSRSNTQLLRALVAKGVSLEEIGRLPDALDSYEKVLSMLGETVGPEEKELFSTALLHRGMVLRTLGRHAEAVTAFDEMAQLVERTGK